MLTSLLTAIYMFRLVFLAFHGERRTRAAAPAHPEERSRRARRTARAHRRTHTARRTATAHLHDAPPAMAIALIVLAIGSVVAGYVGVPHALGGAQSDRAFLEPSFERRAVARAGRRRRRCRPTRQRPTERGERHAPARRATELTLMVVSSGVALAGIGIAAFFFLHEPRGCRRAWRERFAGLHRCCSNKYYVDEIYDAAIVQPISSCRPAGCGRASTPASIDGAVNGVGAAGRAAAARCCGGCRPGRSAPTPRRCSSAWSLILGYYLWR